MPKDNENAYYCRVCGFKQAFFPWGEDDETPTFEICGCCGVQFGYQDCTPFYAKKFREEWLNGGAGWVCLSEKPKNWSLEQQLKHIPKEFR